MAMPVRVGSKFQVVIPYDVRQKIDLHPKDEVIVEVIAGTVVIVPKPKSFTSFMTGLGKELWKGVDVKDYIRKERELW